MGGAARAILDDASDRVGIEVAQAVARDLGADERRVAAPARSSLPGHLHVEVGPDAEQLAHVLVERVHQLVQLARADEHDLDVDRHRVGRERGGREHHELLAEVLDLGDSRAQRSP